MSTSLDTSASLFWDITKKLRSSVSEEERRQHLGDVAMIYQTCPPHIQERLTPLYEEWKNKCVLPEK